MLQNEYSLRDKMIDLVDAAGDRNERMSVCVCGYVWDEAAKKKKMNFTKNFSFFICHLAMPLNAGIFIFWMQTTVHSKKIIDARKICMCIHFNDKMIIMIRTQHNNKNNNNNKQECHGPYVCMYKYAVNAMLEKMMNMTDRFTSIFFLFFAQAIIPKLVKKMR